MKCPFCASEITDEAHVCPHCARDIYPFRPQIIRIEALEYRVDFLESLHLKNEETRSDSPEDMVIASLSGWLRQLATPFGLLILAHLLITQAWDTREWVMYVAAILVSLVPGFLLTRQYRCSLTSVAVAGFSMATVAILIMSGVTCLFDGGDWLPHTPRDWREFINFWLSIGFAYLAGAFAGQALSNHIANSLRARKNFAATVLSTKFDSDKMRLSMQRIDNIANAAPAVLAAIASIYSGLGRFFGP